MEQTQWGSAIEDLSISLSLDQTVFKPGDTIRLNISRKNVGSAPITIAVASPWIDHILSVRDESGRELPESQHAQQMREAAVEGRRVKRQLMPEEVMTETLELDKAYDLKKPGRYTVSAKHQTFKKGTLNQFAEVPSNELVIQITS